MTDPFAAFDQRMKRRLSEMLEDARRDFGAVDAQMAARGLFNSGARIRGQLDKIKTHVEKATDWALIEANGLPGQPHVTRMVVAPHLKANLDAHLNGLFDAVRWLQDQPSIVKVIADERGKMLSSLNGELSDFEAGLWHPKNGQQAGTNVTNTVNVHGPNNGVIQQAGDGATQIASQAEGAIDEFLAKLAATAIAEDVKQEMRAQAETLRIQAKRAAPNRTVMQAVMDELHQLALGVGGNVLTPYVVTLAAALGIHLLTTS